MLMITALSIILIWLIIFNKPETKAFPNDLIILILLSFGMNAYIYFY